jgi:Mg2+ and Co2+ transporter CorA
MEVTLQPSLFQGGYEDILGPASYVKNETQHPERLSHLEDIVFYWTRKRPPTFDAKNPTLLSLMYYPLKIVAAEWVVYLELFNRLIRQYEYSREEHVQSQSFTRLDSDLRAMQAWIRRCTQTGVKLQFAVMFIQSRSLSEAEKQAYELLSEDYQHLAAMVRRYSDLLETKIQVATSMVQIADSRRSLNEARNVTRLTNLALLFIPMSFITGLLSMNDQISTKGLVWFFSLAIPGCAAVFLVARLPEIRVSRIAGKLRGLKRAPQAKV